MEKKIKVALVFGTRPEAIKMAPLVKEIQSRQELEAITIVTAQHRQMLDQVLELFEITPDYDLNLMRPNQNLWGLTSDVLLQTKEIFEKVKPDIVLVHGDTTTAGATALSAYYARIPIGHVEAGLRTFNKDYPFPEEINRVLADAVSDMHFCPTQGSVDNIKNSGIKTPESIYKTGNTVIDALLYTVNNKEANLEIKVNKQPVATDTPSGLNYNTETGNIVWNPVLVNVDNEVIEVNSYLVSITTSDGEVVKEVIGDNKLKIDESGILEIKVKCKEYVSNGKTIYEGSDYSQPIVLSCPGWIC